MEYEKSKHRRWKTGVLLTPLALLSKGKKHWFGHGQSLTGKGR